MKRKIVQLPAHQTRALVELQSVNRERRTIEVVWTTGERGLRKDKVGHYYEELSLDPQHLDLKRLNAGASVLDNHDKTTGLKTVIGSVERAWIVSPTEARAEIRLSSDPAKQGTVNDILDGIIRNVSVGYSVRKLKEVGFEGDIPVLRAISWSPFELSFVPVGFDSRCQTRGDEENITDCTVLTNTRNNEMTPEEIEAKRQKDEADAAEATRVAEQKRAREAEETSTRAIEAERTRAAEITELVTRSALSPDVSARLIKEGKSVDETRKFVLDEIHKRDAGRGGSGITMGSMNEHDTMFRAMEETLLVRAAPEFNKPTELSNKFRGSTLLDMAKESLRVRGIDHWGRSRNEIAGLALQGNLTRGLHTTSDFPLILGNTVRKILADNFAIQQSDYQWFTRPVTVTDYKAITRFGLSSGPGLLEVKEGAEYKRGTLTENGQDMKISKFGRIFGVTRELIVNDDIGAFNDVPRMWGQAAQNLVAKLAWNAILTNPVMADNLPLFHASHGNLMTGSALDIANIELAVTMLEAQTRFTAPGEDAEYIGQQARYLVVGPALKYAAIRLTTSVDPIVNSAVNPFSNLIVKSDPRITGNQWFITADPATTDAVGLLQMAGEIGPQTEERNGFDVDGIEYKVRLDTGAKALDHRWIVKNPGV